MTEVARATDLSTPTAFRLLGSLHYRNIVIKDAATNVYMLGPGWLRMLDTASVAFQSIGVLARGPLEELTARTGETSVVHGRIGRERVCLAEVPSPNPVRYSISVGSVAPLHVGASGKVLLAFGDDDVGELLDVLPLEPMTHATVTSQETLTEQLAVIRANGYAFSVGERTPGAAGVTVPVRGHQGFLAALSVIGPADRFSDERVEWFVTELRTAATELEAILGRPTVDGNRAR